MISPTSHLNSPPFYTYCQVASDRSSPGKSLVEVVLLTTVSHIRTLQSTHYNSAVHLMRFLTPPPEERRPAMRSTEIRWDRRSPVVGKNQTRVPQLAQQFRMLLGKELESSRLVRLNAGDIQNNRGKAGNLRIVRLRHLLKPGNVLPGHIPLCNKPQQFLPLLNI